MKKLILIFILFINVLNANEYSCNYYKQEVRKEINKSSEYLKAKMKFDYCYSMKLIIRYAIDGKSECSNNKELVDAFNDILNVYKDAYIQDACK